MNRLKISLFFVLAMNFSQAIGMRGMMREIGRQAMEEMRMQALREAEYKRQCEVHAAVKQQYGLTENIDTSDSDDARIAYLTKVLGASDRALLKIKAKEERQDRIKEYGNLGILLQMAMVEVARENSRIDHYYNRVICYNKDVEGFQETCCCMLCCAESVSINFVRESQRQVEARLESLKCRTNLQTQNVNLQQDLEIRSVVSNTIHDDERL